MGGFVFERLIPSFTNLVFLFMIVSGFGMCCGYYQKFKDQKISVVDFYKKRYNKWFLNKIETFLKERVV